MFFKSLFAKNHITSHQLVSAAHKWPKMFLLQTTGLTPNRLTDYFQWICSQISQTILP